MECAGSCRICGRCNLGAVAKTLNDFLAQSGASRDQIAHTVVTGSQVVDDLSRFVHFDTFVSEVSAHIAAASHYYPDCRAVLDVGGQDSKAMLFDDAMQIWVAKMSGICAAGTGAFLDSVAAKLSVPVEELADHVNYDSTLELSSVCAVLSATSVNKFKNRYPLGDVIAAACRAQARTIVSGVGNLFLNYDGAIVFQGGVASNRAVAHYLRAITGNRILIPELNQVMGALGAAQIARDCWELEGNSTEQAAKATTRASASRYGEIRRAPSARSRNRRPCGFILRGRSSSPRATPPWCGATCSSPRRYSMRWASAC